MAAERREKEMFLHTPPTPKEGGRIVARLLMGKKRDSPFSGLGRRKGGGVKRSVAIGGGKK